MSSEAQALKNFDYALFKRNNKQLYSQLLDNDINIHELNPYDDSMLATDAKTLFPTLHKQLYGEPTPRYTC